MPLEIGGHDRRTDWPKLGTSLLVATCLVLAIRTARWPVHAASASREMDLDDEIEFAAHLTGRVFAHVLRKWPSLFPDAPHPWYQPDHREGPE